MTGILAIDTATEACSVAVYLQGQYRQQHEVAPRQHSRRLFGMLRELLPAGNLRAQGIDAIAYGCGPGSFTGLRICASAVQGLAYTNELPALAVSTLACQAQTALRTGAVGADAVVLSMLDARINEVYYAIYSFTNELPVLRFGPRACAPAGIEYFAQGTELHAVGSGCQFIDELAPDVRQQVTAVSPQVLPEARDLVPLALASLAAGATQSPGQVQPVYVRDEISWKKLAEQGKPA